MDQEEKGRMSFAPDSFLSNFFEVVQQDKKLPQSTIFEFMEEKENESEE